MTIANENITKNMMNQINIFDLIIKLLLLDIYLKLMKI
jgi:hypothetical protein